MASHRQRQKEGDQELRRLMAQAQTAERLCSDLSYGLRKLWEASIPLSKRDHGEVEREDHD